jgi:hypothetical protein
VAEKPRIVIALETASLVGPVIETGAALAAGLKVMLDALFVEDERLLRLAALPFAHELGFPSARLRRLDAADVERALRAQVDQVRKQLAAIAAALELPWQLNVVRGDVLRTAFGYATVTDILVVGRSVTASIPDAEPPTRERFASLRRRAVLTLFDASAASAPALEAAQGLAGVVGAELAVLIPASGPEPFRRLREQAGAVAGARRPAPAKYVFLPDAAPGTVARAVRAQGGGALFWPSAGARDPATLSALVDAVPCPVVLVG